MQADEKDEAEIAPTTHPTAVAPQQEEARLMRKKPSVDEQMDYTSSAAVAAAKPKRKPVTGSENEEDREAALVAERRSIDKERAAIAAERAAIDRERQRFDLGWEMIEKGKGIIRQELDKLVAERQAWEKEREREKQSLAKRKSELDAQESDKAATAGGAASNAAPRGVEQIIEEEIQRAARDEIEKIRGAWVLSLADAEKGRMEIERIKAEWEKERDRQLKEREDIEQERGMLERLKANLIPAQQGLIAAAAAAAAAAGGSGKGGRQPEPLHGLLPHVPLPHYLQPQHIQPSPPPHKQQHAYQPHSSSSSSSSSSSASSQSPHHQQKQPQSQQHGGGHYPQKHSSHSGQPQAHHSGASQQHQQPRGESGGSRDEQHRQGAKRRRREEDEHRTSSSSSSSSSSAAAAADREKEEARAMDDDEDNEYGTLHPRKERRVSSSTQEGDYEYSSEYVRSRTRRTWEERYEELKQFQQKHGHLYIPYSGNMKQLYEWVSTQRKNHRKKSLKKDRFLLLDALGFPWTGKRELLAAAKHTSSPPRSGANSVASLLSPAVDDVAQPSSSLLSSLASLAHEERGRAKAPHSEDDDDGGSSDRED